MKRAIYIIPAATTLEGLTPEQQAAIASVDSQFTLPMPGTIAVDGRKVVDGLVSDAFDPAVMPNLGLDWQLAGLFEWDLASPTLAVLAPLDKPALLPYMAPITEFAEDGTVISTTPATSVTVAGWAGWPAINTGEAQ